MPMRQAVPRRKKKIRGNTGPSKRKGKRKSVFEKSRLRRALRRTVVSLRGKAALAAARNRRTSINRKKRKTQPKWRTRY